MSEAGVKGARGPAFTSFEDLLICKAFIAASEDPTVGTYQKGSNFQLKVHQIYCKFLDDHEKISSSLLMAVPPSNTNQIPSTFNRRTSKSILDRFKNVIAPRVNKFMAIVEVTPRESGKNDDDFLEQCKELFALQTTYGDFEPFRKCYDYLINKPKFASWRGLHMNGAATVKKERPIGSKQAKETKAVKEVARKVISKKDVTNPQQGHFNDSMQRMMSNFNSFVEMRMMKDMGHGLTNEEINDLDTPECKEY